MLKWLLIACLLKIDFNAYCPVLLNSVNRIGTKQIGSIDDCGRHATLPHS